MARPTADREIQLAELKKEVTKRGFDRHASVLKNILELPAELQSPAVTELATREIVQDIIAFPPQIQRGSHYIPKQALLFTTAGLTHLLASIWPGREPQITCINGCDLLYVKVTLLLLYGFLDIAAQGQDSPMRLAIEFNTVAWHRLYRPLQRLLQATEIKEGALTAKVSPSLDALEALRQLPIKFSNGVRTYGLLPGQELEELVFQPGIWERWLYLFRRPLLANTLLLLTSNYMVVIQEDLNVKQGWLLSYIPRDNIAGIQNQPCGLWNEISVQLTRGGQSADYEFRLQSEAVDAWRTRWIGHNGRWKELPAQKLSRRTISIRVLC